MGIAEYRWHEGEERNIGEGTLNESKNGRVGKRNDRKRNN